jgi:hypothetical protein
MNCLINNTLKAIVSKQSINLWPIILKRGVIGTSHASQRDDEVFTSKLTGSDAGIVVIIV